MGVTEDDVFAFGLSLPRATEGTVRGRRKLYVGRIVFAALDAYNDPVRNPTLTLSAEDAV